MLVYYVLLAAIHQLLKLFEGYALIFCKAVAVTVDFDVGILF